MSKLFSTNRLGTLLVTLGFWVGISSSAMAQDNFALVIGPLDHLDIFGPKGERVAEVPVPTIAQTLTVGTTTFQISYGRDADDLLTAVLTPNSSQPQDLHFSVMGKNIDADKEAVVTLTFPDAHHVTVDPGYIGTVTVNSRNIRHHELADDTYAPRTTYHTSSPTPVHLTSTSSSNAAPAPRLLADVAPLAVPPSVSSPASVDPTVSGATSSPVSGAPPPVSVKKMYWSQPVTPAHGPPPSVGTNEMKLVNVHGAVTVQTPDGATVPGREGMLVPSGSAVETAGDSSAAVFMGGVNSARFLPNSHAAVTQSLNGSVRKTDINLTKGTVFCRVGKRAGEKQDYEVRTPQGVAAARGTELAVSITDIGGVSYTVCFTNTGVVTLSDNNGNSFSVTPQSVSQIAFGSVGGKPLSTTTITALLIQALAVLQPFNPPPSGATTSDVVTTATTLLNSLTSTTSSVLGGTTTTKIVNPDGTVTTITTSQQADGSTTTTSTTTDPTTGNVIASSNSDSLVDPTTGNVVTTTENTVGNNTTTSTSTGTVTTGTTTGTTGITAPSTPAATGTLNTTSDLTPF